MDKISTSKEGAHVCTKGETFYLNFSLPSPGLPGSWQSRFEISHKQIGSHMGQFSNPERVRRIAHKRVMCRLKIKIGLTKSGCDTVESDWQCHSAKDRC